MSFSDFHYQDDSLTDSESECDPESRSRSRSRFGDKVDEEKPLGRGSSWNFLGLNKLSSIVTSCSAASPSTFELNKNEDECSSKNVPTANVEFHLDSVTHSRSKEENPPTIPVCQPVIDCSKPEFRRSNETQEKTNEIKLKKFDEISHHWRENSNNNERETKSSKDDFSSTASTTTVRGNGGIFKTLGALIGFNKLDTSHTLEPVEDEQIRHHRDVMNPALSIRSDGYMLPLSNLTKASCVPKTKTKNNNSNKVNEEEPIISYCKDDEDLVNPHKSQDGDNNDSKENVFRLCIEEEQDAEESSKDCDCCTEGGDGDDGVKSSGKEKDEENEEDEDDDGDDDDDEENEEKEEQDRKKEECIIASRLKFQTCPIMQCFCPAPFQEPTTQFGDFPCRPEWNRPIGTLADEEESVQCCEEMADVDQTGYDMDCGGAPGETDCCCSCEEGGEMEVENLGECQGKGQGQGQAKGQSQGQGQDEVPKFLPPPKKYPPMPKLSCNPPQSSDRDRDLGRDLQEEEDKMAEEEPVQQTCNYTRLCTNRPFCPVPFEAPKNPFKDFECDPCAKLNKTCEEQAKCDGRPLSDCDPPAPEVNEEDLPYCDEVEGQELVEEEELPLCSEEDLPLCADGEDPYMMLEEGVIYLEDDADLPYCEEDQNLPYCDEYEEELPYCDEIDPAMEDLPYCDELPADDQLPYCDELPQQQQSQSPVILPPHSCEDQIKCYEAKLAEMAKNLQKCTQQICPENPKSPIQKPNDCLGETKEPVKEEPKACASSGCDNCLCKLFGICPPKNECEPPPPPNPTESPKEDAPKSASPPPADCCCPPPCCNTNNGNNCEQLRMYRQKLAEMQKRLRCCQQKQQEKRQQNCEAQLRCYKQKLIEIQKVLKNIQDNQRRAAAQQKKQQEEQEKVKVDNNNNNNNCPPIQVIIPPCTIPSVSIQPPSRARGNMIPPGRGQFQGQMPMQSQDQGQYPGQFQGPGQARGPSQGPNQYQGQGQGQGQCPGQVPGLPLSIPCQREPLSREFIGPPLPPCGPNSGPYSQGSPYGPRPGQGQGQGQMQIPPWNGPSRYSNPNPNMNMSPNYPGQFSGQGQSQDQAQGQVQRAFPYFSANGNGPSLPPSFRPPPPPPPRQSQSGGTGTSNNFGYGARNQQMPRSSQSWIDDPCLKESGSGCLDNNNNNNQPTSRIPIAVNPGAPPRPSICISPAPLPSCDTFKQQAEQKEDPRKAPPPERDPCLEDLQKCRAKLTELKKKVFASHGLDPSVILDENTVEHPFAEKCSDALNCCRAQVQIQEHKLRSILHDGGASKGKGKSDQGTDNSAERSGKGPKGLFGLGLFDKGDQDQDQNDDEDCLDDDDDGKANDKGDKSTEKKKNEDKDNSPRSKLAKIFGTSCKGVDRDCCAPTTKNLGSANPAPAPRVSRIPVPTGSVSSPSPRFGGSGGSDCVPEPARTSDNVGAYYGSNVGGLNDPANAPNSYTYPQQSYNNNDNNYGYQDYAQAGMDCCGPDNNTYSNSYNYYYPGYQQQQQQPQQGFNGPYSTSSRDGNYGPNCNNYNSRSTTNNNNNANDDCCGKNDIVEELFRLEQEFNRLLEQERCGPGFASMSASGPGQGPTVGDDCRGQSSSPSQGQNQSQKYYQDPFQGQSRGDQSTFSKVDCGKVTSGKDKSASQSQNKNKVGEDPTFCEVKERLAEKWSNFDKAPTTKVQSCCDTVDDICKVFNTRSDFYPTEDLDTAARKKIPESLLNPPMEVKRRVITTGASQCDLSCFSSPSTADKSHMDQKLAKDMCKCPSCINSRYVMDDGPGKSCGANDDEDDEESCFDPCKCPECGADLDENGCPIEDDDDDGDEDGGGGGGSSGSCGGGSTNKCDSDKFDLHENGKPIYEGGMCMTRATHYMWKTCGNECDCPVRKLGLDTEWSGYDSYCKFGAEEDEDSNNNKENQNPNCKEYKGGQKMEEIQDFLWKRCEK